MQHLSMSLLAYALSVVRSKPTHSTIQDHLAQLRRRFDYNSLPLNQEAAISSERDDADTCERDLRRLQDRCLDLENENQELRLRADLNQKPTTGSGRTTTKRKADCTNRSANDARASKKGKPDDVGTASKFPEDGRDDGFDQQGLRQTEHTARGHLLRSLYSLHILTCQAEPASVDLARALSKSVTQLRSMMLSASDAAFERATPGLETCEARNATNHVCWSIETTRAMVRAFKILLRGLSVLDGSLKGDMFRNNAVDHLVSIFTAVMTSLPEAANAEIGSSGHEPATAQPTKSSRRAQAPSTTTEHQSSDMISLTQLGIALFESLDPTLPLHNLVFQGMLYHLLTNTGRLIQHFTFSEAAIRPKYTSTPTLPTTESQEHHTALLQARYLRPLLRTALSLAPQHLRPGSTAQYLTDTVRLRLQRTLVHSIFSDGILRDDIFHDRLVAPETDARIEDLLNREDAEKRSKTKGKGRNGVEDAEGQSEGDLFVGEVWELLGWQVLASEGDLAAMSQGGLG